MIREHQKVVLTTDLDEDDLKAGDVGTVVDVDPKGRGFTVEFVTLTGETVAVVPVKPDQIRAAVDADRAHARSA